ncbi:hypothetical protein DKY63_07295 [Pseudomonas putida]|uniref:Uncharacterized protein n=1 Tax=Pseudomonas putida TaxID=303 RepID=A0A2Z4RIA4_PSEPU|nr:hypothetical protein DKY63_07295 [Pseudomonas putida]
MTVRWIGKSLRAGARCLSLRFIKVRFSVGASLLAMVVNDNAGCLTPRGVLRFIASRLAPTKAPRDHLAHDLRAID